VTLRGRVAKLTTRCSLSFPRMARHFSETNLGLEDAAPTVSKLSAVIYFFVHWESAACDSCSSVRKRPGRGSRRSFNFLRPIERASRSPGGVRLIPCANRTAEGLGDKWCIILRATDNLSNVSDAAWTGMVTRVAQTRKNKTARNFPANTLLFVI
jgi:hypothetical protein